MLTDTHCHLFYDQIKTDLDSVLERAKTLGVNRFICVATNLDDANECLELSKKYESIYASVGIHPHDSKNAPNGYREKIYNLMKNDKMVAVGEMGLDYFRNISSPKVQKEVFRAQMEIAEDLNMPVIFHNRDADNDVLSILKDFPSVVGVAHCFSSTEDTATKLIELGYYISFSGNITFKNSHLPEFAGKLPLDRILVETDCPYLSPVPFRGKPNEPGRARFVAEKISEIFKLPFEIIASETTKNASKLFNL